MDPNLFHLDWEQTFEVLAGIVVAAFLVERFLSVLFENRALLPFFAGSGAKEMTSLAAAFAFCFYTKFDAVSVIFSGEQVGLPGWIITAGVISGGAKASVKLFRDVLGFRSSAYQEYVDLRDEGKTPKAAAEAVARSAPPKPPSETSPPSTMRGE